MGGYVTTIDVSRHQGPINWTRVATTGIAGTWIKIGGSDGPTDYKDPQADTNLAGATNVGYPVGTYYFAQPARGDAEPQARHAVSIGHGTGRLSPALDLEISNGLAGWELDQWALAWCQEIRRLIGRESIIYTGKWIGTQSTGYFGESPWLTNCPLWIANYGRNTPGLTTPVEWTPTVPAAWVRPGWSMWQHNSLTVLPGITENTVDANVATGAFWAAQTGGTPPVFEGMNMKRLVDRNGTQWLLTTDGSGAIVKAPIPDLLTLEVYKLAELCDPSESPTDIPDALLPAFGSIPQVGNTPFGWGLVGLTTQVQKTVTDARDVVTGKIDGIPASSGGGATAEQIADTLASRLKD